MTQLYDLYMRDHFIQKNFNHGRQGVIREIVLHHNASHGVDPVQVWQTREASAHCQVWGDGRVDFIVHFMDTAWHAHEANPYSIGIEHENSRTGDPWPIADAALHASAKLVGYLCARFNLGEPLYRKNVTTHYAIEHDHVGVDSGTACPGPYFLSVLANSGHWYWKEARAAYAKAKGIPVVPPPTPLPTKSKGMQATTLAKVATIEGHTVTYSGLLNRLYFDKNYGGPSFTATTWMLALNQALIRAGCVTVSRVAMFLAQLGAESGSFRYTEEIASGAAYEGRADLGNIYPGDGVRFKGRSYIQITGRHNYTALSAWAHAHGFVPTATYFVDNPKMLADVQYIFLGAVWYWTVARNMNYYADRHDIVGATKAVNGGLNNLSGRTARWNYALKFGNSLLPTGVTLSPAPKPAPAPSPVPYYTVRSGDTLSGIASRYHTTYQVLQKLNGIANPNLIRVGQRIRLPGSGIPIPPPAPTTYVTVQSGDTLSGIAARYHTSWQTLQRLNNLRDPNRIYVGQRLRVR